MAEWFFSKKGVNDKERDPGWDEYFSSNRSTVESLVRESIQNSLDAARKAGSKQALVRIYYSGQKCALPVSEYAPYLGSAKGHYAAEECYLKPIDGDCEFFVIEDFNTCGLVGDVLAENETEPYFKFLKCENKSTKNEPGNIGKWGIGKVVFPIASRLRTFFAYSIRKDTEVSASRPREVLAGECLLRYHSVGENRYTPDGWRGGAQVTGGKDNGKNQPVTGETGRDVIDEFKRRFRITRKDEPGLSVVVPYVEPVSLTELERSIVENYMVALADGSLRVELCGGDGTNEIYDNEHATEILDALKRLASADEADDDTKRLAEFYQMALEAQTIPDKSVRVLAPYAGAKPDWQEEQFVADTVKQIQADIDTEKNSGTCLTVVDVPICINKKHVHDKPVAKFRVVLQRCASKSMQTKPRFYRQGLFISHVGAHNVPGFMAIVLLDGPVADMLNEAEPPSHTQWFSNTGSFSKTYNYPDDIIAYVKRAPRQIVKHVDKLQDKDDFETLKKYFSLSRDGRMGTNPGNDSDAKTGGDGGVRGGTGKARRKKKRKLDPDRPRPTPPLPRPYLLEKYIDEKTGESCFRVIADPQNFRSFMFTADIAYATLSGKSAYDENDFSLQKGGHIRVFALGAKTRFPRPNAIEALIEPGTQDFMIDIKGFDPNRDLEVDDHYRDPAKWDAPEVANG